MLLQNTKDYLDYALEIWNESNKEHQLTQTANFLAMLAINQNQPVTALEILPVSDKHFSSTNVRLIALSDCGRFPEAIEILKNIPTNTRDCKMLEEVVITKITR